MLTKQLDEGLVVSDKTERFSETTQVLVKLRHSHDDGQRLSFNL